MYGSRREIHHPDVEWLNDNEDLAAIVAGDPVNFGRTVPFYPLTEGSIKNLSARCSRR